MESEDIDTDTVYRVKFKPKDETSKRCKLKGWYNLVVKDRGLCLYDESNKVVVLKWPFQFIRRFTKNPDNFIVEAGRRCACGEGIFTMQTKEGLAIFTSMVEKINIIANSCTPPLTPESTRSSVSTLGSVREEPHPLPRSTLAAEDLDVNPYTEPFYPQSPSAQDASPENQSSPIQAARKMSEYENNAEHQRPSEHYMTMQNKHIDSNAPVQHYENMPPVRKPSLKEKPLFLRSSVKFKEPVPVQHYESMQPVGNAEPGLLGLNGDELVQPGSLSPPDPNSVPNHYELMQPIVNLSLQEEGSSEPCNAVQSLTESLDTTPSTQDTKTRTQPNSKDETLRQDSDGQPCRLEDRPPEPIPHHDTVQSLVRPVPGSGTAVPHYDTVPTLIRPVPGSEAAVPHYDTVQSLIRPVSGDSKTVHHYDEPCTGSSRPEPHYDTPNVGNAKSTTLPVRHYANMKLSNAPVQHYLTMQTSQSEH